MEKDYYKILGVTDEEKKLTGDEFKKMLNKKFRALSLKYHPDKYVNKSEAEQKEAEEKFKEISEANTVLSDPKARAQYDNGGMQGMSYSDFMSHFGFSDDFDPFESFFGRRSGRQRQARGNDATVEVTVTMDEAFRGCTKEITINKETKCEKCNGTGSSDGKTHQCRHCNGTGVIINSRQEGNMIWQSQATCPYCQGTGKEKSTPCSACGGSGVKYKSVRETIEVPAGIDNDMSIRYTGKGNSPIGGDGINGDLIVTFKVKNDGYFDRVDSINVIHYEYIPFNECLLGFNRECKTIDGGKVYINGKECTKDGQTFMFKGMGFPVLRNGGFGSNQRGDYAVIIKYIYPTTLNDKQREALKNFNK